MTMLHNEKGSVLITVLVILTLLTIIGIAATNTSTLETMISATEKTHSAAFYAAEAGIEHQRRSFKSIFHDENQAKLAAGQDPDWDFALVNDATAAGDTPSYANGHKWIEGGDLAGDYTYNVTVWDNDDGGTAGNQHRDDTDGLIYLRADAQVPGGGTASIEILLQGTTTAGTAINDNKAQVNNGSDKSSSGDDVTAIDLNTTLIQ